MGYENEVEANKAVEYKVDYFGKTYPIVLIDIDNENDLCIFKFKSEFANQSYEIEIANDYPNIGEKIYSIGAPFAISDSKIRLHFK